MRAKPGTRWLLLACLLALPLTLLSPVQRLEDSLYDAQQRLARAFYGRQSVHPRIAVMALDDRALDRGLGPQDLSEAVANLGPSAAVARSQEMRAFYQPDSDGTLRAITLVRQTPEGLELCPPLRHLIAFQGLKEQDVSWQDGRLNFGGTTLQTDAQGRVYPLFPMTDLQTGQLQGWLSAAGLRTLLDFGRGIGSLDALDPASLSDLQSALPLLRGKLVILGTHQKIADGLELPTPTGNMVSLDLYTATMDSLLQGNLLRPLSLGANLMLTFIFLALICWALPGKPTANAVGVWLFAVVVWLSLGLALFCQGHVVKLAPALTVSAAALFVHLILRSRRLTQTLMGFGGDVPGQGQEKEVTATICFTNLPGPLKQWESSDPPRAKAARADYARCLGRVVHQHGGRLVDQQGDAQMLAFGLDGEPNHQALALACALDIVASVGQWLAESQKIEQGRQLVHCGLNTGTVASGQVGGGSYRSVAAIGDTTNAAARLMGQAEKQGVGVLAARTTTVGQGARLNCRSAGEISLRGRQEPLQVDEVISFAFPPRPLALRPSTAWPRAATFWLLASVVLSTLAAILIDGLLPLRFALLDSLTPTSKAAKVVFAGIDEESLAFAAWPWPRGQHARAIANCRQAGASCIFFDVVFDHPSSSPSDDTALAQVARSTSQLVLAAIVAENKPPQLIEGLLDTQRWGLINVATDPTQGDRRLREALWQWDRYPGVAQSVARVVAPNLLTSMAKEGSFFIRWGPAPKVVSYHRLLDPTDPVMTDLRGAVVVVGDNTNGPQDTFETPYGLKKGAFIHALSAQTMLNGQVLVDRSVGPWSWLFSFLLAGLTAGFAMRSTGPGQQMVILVALCALAVAVVLAWLPFGYYLGTRALVVVPCALLLGICLKAMGLTQALLRYVPQRLQQRLETENSVPDKDVWATVMVTDIRGYTTLSEKRSPLEILKLLNRYHEVTASCYESLGGHLLTYQGDAQIVVFGALEPLASPVMSAIKAAQRLPDLVAQVSEEFHLSQAEKLSVGAGVATGKMSLVLIQAADQLQYTVLGEPIRRAHGLQSLSDELQSSLLLDSESARAIADVQATQSHISTQGLTAFTL